MARRLPEILITGVAGFIGGNLAERLLREGYRVRGIDDLSYGVRQDYRRTVPPLMSAFILNLLRGKRPTIYGDGSKRRDFIYVDDVNDFHLLCLKDPRTVGGTFNLGSGANHSVLEIYREISD